MIRLRPAPLQELVARHGGRVGSGGERPIDGVASVHVARARELAPLMMGKLTAAAIEAAERGACLLIDEALLHRRAISTLLTKAPGTWVHPNAAWALAELLDGADVPSSPPQLDESCMVSEGVYLGPRVVIGARVRIGPHCVIGRPGFGWARDPRRGVRSIPQLGGVVIEDDVEIGPLCTIDAGTLGPTILRRGVKLDAHVHVGHNCVIGEGTIVAAQSGFAGSVTIGRHVLVGGQVGIADHVTVGDNARIAAKSGVIGDVAPGAIVAGYPAVPRGRWLRGLAKLYRGLRGRRDELPDE